MPSHAVSLKTVIAAAFIATVATAPVRAATLDDELRVSVHTLIMGMKEGPVAQLGEPEREELAACIHEVMSDMPEEKKQYIVDASDDAELRARFDEVGLENKAALKQQISRECAP